MNPLTLEVFCASTGAHEDAVESWQKNMAQPWPVWIDATIEGPGAGYLTKLQKGYECCKSDVIAYFHNDTIIDEYGWDERVLREFQMHPDVVVVSFCGAKTHGRDEIYRAPYDFRQLARGGFISNLKDAEVHGRRVLGSEDVAVIDSFSCIVRTQFLNEIGGWNASGLLESHCSDYWICLMAHRYGARVRYVSVACTHNSGGVRGDGRFSYADWQREIGFTDADMHQINHRKLYDEFRDVLPVRVP